MVTMLCISTDIKSVPVKASVRVILMVKLFPFSTVIEGPLHGTIYVWCNLAINLNNRLSLRQLVISCSGLLSRCHTLFMFNLELVAAQI